MISSSSKKLPVNTYPKICMFFAGLMLVIVSVFCINSDLITCTSHALLEKEFQVTTSHVDQPETTRLISAEMFEKKEVNFQQDELKQRQRVASWIAKHYRIANSASNLFVTTAYKTASELELDPLLILAVIAIESRYNPFAESAAGAQGLMQVMTKVHANKFKDHGGLQYALDPVINIKVGSEILKNYIKQTGSIELALKSYVGSAAMSHDRGYGSKIMSEYRKLKTASLGIHDPVFVPAKSRSDKMIRSEKIKDNTSPVEIETQEKPSHDQALLL